MALLALCQKDCCSFLVIANIRGEVIGIKVYLERKMVRLNSPSVINLKGWFKYPFGPFLQMVAIQKTNIKLTVF